MSLPQRLQRAAPGDDLIEHCIDRVPAETQIGAFEYRPQLWNVFLVPLVATFVMLPWDMSMDPSNSTINGSWVWLQGGGYFGVPFSNFVPGWFLTVYIFLQIFALYLYRFSNAPVESRVIEPKAFWFQP